MNEYQEKIKDYRERVADERRALDEKLGKLNTFAGTDTFKALPRKEQMMLIAQSRIMAAYSDVLAMRIDYFLEQEKVPNEGG